MTPKKFNVKISQRPYKQWQNFYLSVFVGQGKTRSQRREKLCVFCSQNIANTRYDLNNIQNFLFPNAHSIEIYLYKNNNNDNINVLILRGKYGCGNEFLVVSSPFSKDISDWQIIPRNEKIIVIHVFAIRNNRIRLKDIFSMCNKRERGIPQLETSSVKKDLRKRHDKRK